jgi:RNA 3'-terminal phosphate cyclase (ATP)
VLAAAAICGAEVEGADLESQTLLFAPAGPSRSGEYEFDIAEVAGQGSAGSVGLVLQTILLPLVMCEGESRLTLRGGTHVPWAPSVDYLAEVFCPSLARMGITTEVELTQWGFYPVGGGQMQVHIQGRATAPLEPIDLTNRGGLKRAWGRGVVANLPSHIPQRMANRARNLLMTAGIKAELRALRVRAAGPGAGIFLFVEYEGGLAGFTAYGRKGLPSDQVAQMACEPLLAHHETGAAVDPYLADQLVLPMVLAAGTSRITTSRVTEHLLTNLEVVRAFLPIEATVGGAVGKPGMVIISRGGND